MTFHRIYFIPLIVLFAFFFESCLTDKTNEEVILSGKVVDSSGSTIGEVSVNVELISEKIVTQTSSDGSYLTLIPHGGTARITFSKEGYTSQLIKTAFKDGAAKEISIRMNTLAEDAFFETNITNVAVSATQGLVSVIISTNVNFEVECLSDWISWQLIDKNLMIRYQANNTEVMRTAVIKLKAEYGLYCDITLTQSAP